MTKDNDVTERFKQALEEVQEYKKGKHKSRSWREMMEELESEWSEGDKETEA